ncbi:MAG: hypothetical protein V1728_00630 [Candidatus Micrarchaeota archaeon]
MAGKRIGKSAIRPQRAGWGRPSLAYTSAFVLFLFMASALFAQGSGGIPQGPGGLFNGAPQYGALISLMMVGLAAVVAALAGIYMIAGAVKQAEWQALVRGELYQAVVSVVWGLVIFGSAISIDKIIDAYATGNNMGGMFGAARSYVDQVICLSSTNTIKLEGMKIAAQYLASMRGRHYAGAWGISVPVFPGFEILERALDLLQTFTMPFTSSLFVQAIGLEIIHATAFTIIMPAGILMRIFPQTREAGSFLIASAFGFYFVFPFTYLINAQVMNQLYSAQFGYPMCGGGDGGPGAIQQVGTQKLYFDVSSALVPSATQDLLGLDTRIPFTNGKVSRGGMMQNISYMVFQSVFLPSLSMVITVTFIRNALRFFSQKME